MKRLGKSADGRERLGKLVRKAGKILTIEKSAGILEVTNQEAAKILSRWVKQGWLIRIKQGLYANIPIWRYNWCSNNKISDAISINITGTAN